VADAIPYYTDEALRIAFWRNVALIDISGEMTLRRMAVTGSAYRELLTEQPKGLASLSLLRPGVPVSTPDARAEGVRFVKDLGDRMLVNVMVVEDAGIFAQTMRTVVRGINVQVRGPRLVVHPSVDDGMRVVLPFVANKDGSADLAGELREVMAEHRRAASEASAPSLRQAR
jgi:hypothetical protein